MPHLSHCCFSSGLVNCYELQNSAKQETALKATSIPLTLNSKPEFRLPSFFPNITYHSKNPKVELPIWTHCHFVDGEYTELEAFGYEQDTSKHQFPFSPLLLSSISTFPNSLFSDAKQSTSPQPNVTAPAHLLHDLFKKHGGIHSIRYFLHHNTQNLITFCDVGHRICGHKGIAHGGFTASILDNTLGILACVACQGPAATKTLAIQYKKPLVIDSKILIRAKIVTQSEDSSNSAQPQSTSQPRKIIIQGEIIDQKGHVLATAEGIFVDIRSKWNMYKSSSRS